MGRGNDNMRHGVPRRRALAAAAGARAARPAPPPHLHVSTGVSTCTCTARGAVAGGRIVGRTQQQTSCCLLAGGRHQPHMWWCPALASGWPAGSLHASRGRRPTQPAAVPPPAPAPPPTHTTVGVPCSTACRTPAPSTTARSGSPAQFRGRARAHSCRRAGSVQRQGMPCGPIGKSANRPTLMLFSVSIIVMALRDTSLSTCDATCEHFVSAECSKGGGGWPAW
jgi:hypothetical protein